MRYWPKSMPSIDLNAMQEFSRSTDRPQQVRTVLPAAVGPKPAHLAQCIHTGPFHIHHEKLTGIPNLIADPSYFGGGVHWIDNGGYLEVHADFNHLKKYNLARRINLLLYLNKDWKDEYNGHLELWDRSTMAKRKAVAPLVQSGGHISYGERGATRTSDTVECAARCRSAITGALLLHQYVGARRAGSHHSLLHLPKT